MPGGREGNRIFEDLGIAHQAYDARREAQGKPTLGIPFNCWSRPRARQKYRRGSPAGTHQGKPGCV